MHTTLIFVLLFLSSAVVADEGLWKKLQNDPYMVVLIRNAESTGNRDGANMLAWDSTGQCIEESTLTQKGREQAKEIGAVFKKRGITPVVISSPMCRCVETAQIAFGEYLLNPDLRQRHPDDIQGQETFLTVAKEMLSKYRSKSPIIFVNHRPNIDALTLELIDIGELLVGIVTDDGEIEVLGKIGLYQ